MKYQLILLSLFYLITSSFAQDSTRILSKFEQFNAQKGQMLKIETNKVGTVNNIDIAIQRVTSLSSGESKIALSLNQSRTALFAYTGFGSLYIDYDELESLQKALNFFYDEIKVKKPKYDPQYVFTTTNNIVANCSYWGAGIFSGWSITISQHYKYIPGYVPGSLITVKNKDIDDLIEIINKSKGMINF